MFTGLVEAMGQVARLVSVPPGLRMTLSHPTLFAEVTLGDSIAICGCCLTVVEHAPSWAAFELGPETLARTNLGALAMGSLVNLERSLRVGDRIGGHFVTGHVDGLGTVENRQDDGQWCWLTIRYPAELRGQLAAKGSITIDGVSLTLVDVRDDTFSVALIPHTLEVTTLGQIQPGSRVNLETDLLAKYTVAYLSRGSRE